jgi:hypothetical protein
MVYYLHSVPSFASTTIRGVFFLLQILILISLICHVLIFLLSIRLTHFSSLQYFSQCGNWTAGGPDGEVLPVTAFWADHMGASSSTMLYLHCGIRASSSTMLYLHALGTGPAEMLIFVSSALAIWSTARRRLLRSAQGAPAHQRH